nr:hypothetical protein HK105_000542 [Polyrhizophydium stewartii]
MTWFMYWFVSRYLMDPLDGLEDADQEDAEDDTEARLLAKYNGILPPAPTPLTTEVGFEEPMRTQGARTRGGDDYGFGQPPGLSQHFHGFTSAAALPSGPLVVMRAGEKISDPKMQCVDELYGFKIMSIAPSSPPLAGIDNNLDAPSEFGRGFRHLDSQLQMHQYQYQPPYQNAPRTQRGSNNSSIMGFNQLTSRNGANTSNYSSASYLSVSGVSGAHYGVPSSIHMLRGEGSTMVSTESFNPEFLSESAFLSYLPGTGPAYAQPTQHAQPHNGRLSIFNFDTTPSATSLADPLSPTMPHPVLMASYSRQQHQSVSEQAAQAYPGAYSSQQISQQSIPHSYTVSLTSSSQAQGHAAQPMTAPPRTIRASRSSYGFDGAGLAGSSSVTFAGSLASMHPAAVHASMSGKSALGSQMVSGGAVAVAVARKATQLNGGQGSNSGTWKAKNIVLLHEAW